VLGGLHHLAISVTSRSGTTCGASSTPRQSSTSCESEKSIYFRDPDGARLELLADPLGEMYGTKVL
jgi:hypothetical protein